MFLNPTSPLFKKKKKVAGGKSLLYHTLGVSPARPPHGPDKGPLSVL